MARRLVAGALVLALVSLSLGCRGGIRRSRGGNAAPPDGGTDADVDAGWDAAREPGRDAGRDAGREPGRDAGRDTGTVPDAAVLIFSEYVEGSSQNKAIEIANVGRTPVPLGRCEVKRFSNGATMGAPIALDAVELNPGDVYVLAHTDADPAVLAFANQTTRAVNFNGDDALTLECDGAVVDSFGQVGSLPGGAWESADGSVSTRDQTLRRKCSVTMGDTDPSDAFDPSVQWDAFPQDTFDGLGSYGCP